MTSFLLLILLITSVSPFQLSSFRDTDSLDDECQVESEEYAEEFRHPTGPLIPCDSLSSEWFECEDLIQMVADNSSTKNSAACPYFGEKNGVVAKVNITCRALPCIECLGNRHFLREVPCIKYSGYYFLTALLYSVFLGFIAIDRFYLGYSAIGIGKLLTLGGFGVWWISDVVLLLCGSLKPADDSDWQTWQPY